MKTKVPPFLSILKSFALGCAFLVCAGFAIVTTAFTAAATPLTVVIGTSSLSGIHAQLAFDFLDGGTPSNTALISGFATDGTLGGSASTGGGSGSLPGTLTLIDTSFFNEVLSDITLGTSLSFMLDLTTNPPDIGSFADAFSFFILDPATGLPFFATTDPGGGDALFLVEIDGTAGGVLTVFAAPGGEASATVTPVGPASVPEPSTIGLFVAGLSVILGLRRKAVRS